MHLDDISDASMGERERHFFSHTGDLAEARQRAATEVLEEIHTMLRILIKRTGDQ